jgi:rsbT co-antagonist protein RsbR
MHHYSSRKKELYAAYYTIAKTTASAACVIKLLIDTIRELSAPLLPVHDRILVLPLIGHIDSRRSSQIMESMLIGVQRYQARFVIVDITGVPVVDTAVANHLIQATRAFALLGARCIMAGIAPEVAQTLVQLGVDLSGLVTARICRSA